MRDFWRCKITPRELMVYIKFLPVDSAFAQAAAKDAPADSSEMNEPRWTSGDHIAADTYDLLAAVHMKDPKPYPRPADQLAQWKKKQDLAAKLAAQAERNRIRDQSEQRG